MDEKRSARIEAKLDGISEDISEIKVTLGRQNLSLEHHIKRTDTLEDLVKPVIEFMVAARWAGKLIGGISLGVGILTGIIALIEKILNAK